MIFFSKGSVFLEFDVWDRLCAHFEVAKVMTFASVTQHLSRLSSNEYEERENENSLCVVDVLGNELAG